MPANGQYPLGWFIYRGGNIYLSPSLNARWNEAVRLALEKYGIRLYITGNIDGLGGWNGYRPLSAQILYRKHYGIGAAVAGFSSHGGWFRGQEVFALDCANWQDLALGNQTLAWSRFSALMRLVGLTVDFVTPRELWHVGDFNPAWSAPVFGAVTVNPSTTNRPVPPPEEDDMLMLNITTPSSGTHTCALGVGVFRHFIQADPVDRIVKITRSQDDLQTISLAELPAFLRTYGCDLHIWDVRDGKFVVLDPLTGQATPGGMWSAVNAARASVTQVKITSDETRAYVEKLTS